MPEDFFREGEARDELYLSIRDGDHPYSVEARDFVEGLWTEVHPYLDADLPRQAKYDYRTRFWEMYLAAGLLEHGIRLRPREERQPRVKGPDLLLDDGRTWIEAVVARRGQGPDAVPELRASKEAFPIPDEQISLRLTSAIQAKYEKYLKYREAGIVRPEDRYVIAVGGSEIWEARFELDLPRIVRCVFPFGPMVVPIDRETGDFGNPRHLYRGRLEKQGGASVGTDSFLGSDSNGLSAVLYGRADELNHADRVGSEFVLVHNPNADNPMGRAEWPMGTEYWKEEEQLRWKDHAA